MIRAVMDANVLISGLFWKGAPQQVYRAAIREAFLPITTDALIEEFRTVLMRSKFEPNLTQLRLSVEQIIGDFQSFSERVQPAEIPLDDVRDPKDRAILACAVGGNADYVISGDKDLLVLHPYREIEIVTPATFLQRLTNR